MSEIKRVNNGAMAPLDAVELEAKCAVTKFVTRKGKLMQIGSQAATDCKMMASMELGVFSISIPGQARMVSVWLDEVMAVMKEAADCANELAARGKEADAHE